MRMVRISEEVYEEIAKRGRFGETVDDVLRRELGVTKVRGQRKYSRRVIYAQRRMTAQVIDQGASEVLSVRFEGGASREWVLPVKGDVSELKRITDEALHFAEGEGGSKGQLQYIRKALSQAGHYITGPRL
jgi:hypothetical protein